MNPFILLAILIGLMICGSIIIKIYKNKIIKDRKDNKTIWLCVDKSGQEVMIISKNPPHRMPQEYWIPYDEDSILEYDVHFLDDGFIEKRLGKKLTWEDEPVEITQ